ncbi:MAG: ATP synthase F0 subunit C [Thermomicrobiales bacterium]
MAHWDQVWVSAWRCGGAMEALGRNPEAEGAVRTTLIIGAALAEAIAIYAFVIAIILIFAA